MLSVWSVMAITSASVVLLQVLDFDIEPDKFDDADNEPCRL